MLKTLEIITPATPEEFQKLWELNYKIFAEELKMRPSSRQHFLVDKFHHKNIYRAAWDRENDSFAGMISAHWQAPYSAAEHFGEALCTPPPEGMLAEIRLYALLPEYRHTTTASQLAVPLLQELDRQGVSEVIISGISNLKPFYEHIGFHTASSPVPAGDTLLYPMRGKLKLILSRCRKALERYHSSSGNE